jgi:hypothetical protein
MFHKPSDIRLHVAERSRDMPALLRYPIQPSNHLGYVIGPIGEMAAPSWFSSSSNQLEEITAGGMKLDSQVSQLVQAMATYSASNSGFDPTAPASMLLQMTAAFRQLCQHLACLTRRPGQPLLLITNVRSEGGRWSFSNLKALCIAGAGWFNFHDRIRLPLFYGRCRRSVILETQNRNNFVAKIYPANEIGRTESLISLLLPHRADDGNRWRASDDRHDVGGRRLELDLLGDI